MAPEPPLRAVVILALALMLAGCAAPEPPAPDDAGEGPSGDAPAQEEGGGEALPEAVATAYGVALSPKSFQGADFPAFFQEAREVGTVVSWAGDWAQLSDSQGAPRVVATLAPANGLEPAIFASFFNQHDGSLLRPFDETTRAEYKEAAVDFVEAHPVEWLGLGIEINILHEKDPATFDAFVAWYPEVYDAVKAASPGTRVFPIFQYERMAGNHGGLFGGDPDAASSWDLLDEFPKRDLTAFTVYPGLVNGDPGDIPDDYLDAIAAHVDGEVAVTEVGWHTSNAIDGWESSPDEQARFVAWWFGHAPPSVLTLWLSLYDLEMEEPFGSMALKDPDGTPRPAWTAWRAGTKTP